MYLAMFKVARIRPFLSIVLEGRVPLEGGSRVLGAVLIVDLEDIFGALGRNSRNHGGEQSQNKGKEGEGAHD